MSRQLIIDSRMRKIEKEMLQSLGYSLIELGKSESVYEEISSHVDVFVCKIKDKIFVEKSRYNFIKSKLKNIDNLIEGESYIDEKYPRDIKYNICQIGDFSVHNFDYTDKKILDFINNNNLKKVQISQGYSNCSIANITDNAVIVTDKKIEEILSKYKIDVLYVDYVPDIKLLNNGNYSKMNGFIGGAISKIDDKVIIFGDLEKIDKENKILNFIKKYNLKIIDFKGLDVIDYGGIVKI